MSDYNIKWIDRLPKTESWEFLGVISSKLGPVDANLYPSVDWEYVYEQENPNVYLTVLFAELRKREGFSYKDVYELFKDSSIYGFEGGKIFYLGSCDDFKISCSIRIFADGGKDD